MMTTAPAIATSSVPRVALSIAESAQALGLSARYVRELISRGEIRALEVGRRKLVSVEELERFARGPGVAAGGVAA